MTTNSQPQPGGNTPPAKPWQLSETKSGPPPFRQPSAGNTSDIVEASGTAKPGEIVPADRNASRNRNGIGRPVPARPWDTNYVNSYGGYNSGLNYNSSFGSGMYGNYGGTYGESYSSGLYPYRRGYGGMYGGPGLYSSGMYNGIGVPMGGYGMNAPFSDQDANSPYGASSPPGFWISFLHAMQGVVTFFSRVSILIDQNTQAFHMLMSALLQIFDRSGMLYGELARFVFRLLGMKRSRKSQNQVEADPSLGPGHNYVEHPKAANASWDGVWQESSGKWH